MRRPCATGPANWPRSCPCGALAWETISLKTSGACASLRATCWRGLASNGLHTTRRKRTAYTLGWRRAEILGLRVVDVNMAEQTIRIETSKNDHEPGECPLPQTAAVNQRFRVVPDAGFSSKSLAFGT